MDRKGSRRRKVDRLGWSCREEVGGSRTREVVETEIGSERRRTMGWEGERCSDDRNLGKERRKKMLKREDLGHCDREKRSDIEHCSG